MTATLEAEPTGAATAAPPSDRTEGTTLPQRWLVSGSAEGVLALTALGRDLGAEVVEAGDSELAVAGGAALVFVEVSDPAREAVVRAAREKQLAVVAWVPEPTVATVTRLLRLGCRDILAGNPTTETLAARAPRWGLAPKLTVAAGDRSAAVASP